MSWYITATGRPKAVITSLTDQVARHKCAEPEESIKAMFLDIATKSLSVMPDITAVKIKGQGSQQGSGHVAINSFSMEIEPIFGFVE